MKDLNKDHFNNPGSPVDEEERANVDPKGEPAGEEIAPNDITAGTDMVEPESEMEHLNREKEELLSLLQRVKADFDNYRKRARVEQEDIRSYALFNFMGKLLPVLDNMDRALFLARQEGVPSSYIEGAEMIRKLLWNLLEQEGVIAIEARGQKFDPNFHDAVMQIHEGEAEPNTVVEELQKGYVMKGRVLRPSMVKVFTGNET